MTPAIDSRKRASLPSDHSQVRRRLTSDTQLDTFQSVLATAACSFKSSGPPVLAGDSRNVVQHLEQRLKLDLDLTGKFLECFQRFIADEGNLRRILLPMSSVAKNGSVRACDSLARVLLCVGQTQSTVAVSLLEKLPEYVGELEGDFLGGLPPLMDSIPRLILSQFRWLEFLIDSRTLTEKILEVLSICPVGFKKEIITLLPEVVLDVDHDMVVQSLEQMLQDDLQLIVPILDAFSNLNLEDRLFQQVVALALSSLRSADVEDLPLVVKFLLQSATVTNVKQIVQQLRENLHFITVADVRATKPDRKLKGKSTATNCEALVLEAIRSGLRFHNLILEASLKEIRGVEGEKNHKVVDIWLLLIIHANGGPYRKNAEQLLLKKIIREDFGGILLQQCIQGRGDSLQEYFPTLVCMGESCLRSKELVARQFGMNSYVLLFEEFVDSYHRQEVLGALITHTGSGVTHEIGSALETLLLLVTKHAHDLLPISSFINGVLDHLEGFQENHLHQVYRIFSQLAVIAWSSGGFLSGSSVASELLIIIRKQIANSDPKYRSMGIIGAVGLASCLDHENALGSDVLARDLQGSSTEETLSLLQMTLEACKSSSMLRGFFYDELTVQVETAPLCVPFLEWISKHTNEFESLFLGDLDGGRLQTTQDFGEIWMNLDGDMSPIVLNVLPMLMTDDLSSSQTLIYLAANFRLLAAVEGAMNQGSLGSIDALLGCPMLLPKHQCLNGDVWKDLSDHEKKLACRSLFYGINWIRELINTFSTQVLRRMDDSFTQTTREETITKLFKRLRNLIFLEHCLSQCLESTKVSFDILHFVSIGPTQPRHEYKSLSVKQDVNKPRGRKREKSAALRKKECADASGSQKGCEANSQGVPNNGASRQPTISNASSNLKGDVESFTPAVPQGENRSQLGSSATQTANGIGGGLNEQRWKFRPLSLSSMNILAAAQHVLEPCCQDPSAQLPLFLYLLQDLQLKLDWCLATPSRRLAPWINAPVLPKAPSGLGGMSGIDVLRKLAPIFPSLRKHLDCSISMLQSDVAESSQVMQNRTCGEHWVKESLAAGNPPDEAFFPPAKETAESLFLVMINCLSKILSYPELTMLSNQPLLKEFLVAFGALETTDSDSVPPSAPGSLEQALCNAYNYLDSLSEAAAETSFIVATELVMVLKAIVNCSEAYCNRSKDDPRGRRSSFLRSVGILPYLRSRLGLSAGRVLGHHWVADDWKNKGDMLQQLLRLQIQNSDSPIELLEELCSVMPEVPSKGVVHGSIPGYPALSSVTFMIWYRVEHEEVLHLLTKVVKNFLVQSKSKAPGTDDVVAKLLSHAQQCITLHVSLVNLTKSHNKTGVHAMAVKCGGKFVDTFLKGMDFLKSHYDAHKESINALLYGSLLCVNSPTCREFHVYHVKELQKATRIVQTLCSEAKGHKRMPVTYKVPVVKRSMERYVYCVKALLHGTSHGDSFWMGNLKHKDLHGREISSQPYAADEQVENHASDNEDEGINKAAEMEDS